MDNSPMKVRFSKMQGAGNDFVVLDETATRLNLSPAHYRFLADRHFGVGADQILTVLPSPAPGVDFEYKIHNADGGEVEQCGNGARCFLGFVRAHRLTDKTTVKVQTLNRLLELQWHEDGQVTVDMEPPVFELHKVPFDPPGMLYQTMPAGLEEWPIWPLALTPDEDDPQPADPVIVSVAVLSMGNPHAVLQVEDVDTAQVAQIGRMVQRHESFPNSVNVGFMQILGRTHIRLRVYERGAGETLACGTGACAAVVCGIRLGLLDQRVEVQTRGGNLTVQWPGDNAPVMMTGPATLVFEGEIEIPQAL
jgi:diaminopimelate epimerase